ncbi:MAG: replication-relaxation family protein, partial [Actinomycetota bacterium]|nr:replication-relaxation family protein [Actinomycetota bacterium]
MAELGYRRATTLAIAHSRHLPEIVAVNGFFTALTAHARHHPDIDLVRWLSQRQCHEIWGRLVRPYGFGRWRDHDTALEFFLEYRHEERFSDLIAALAGYDALAQATPQLATNVLVWLTSTPPRDRAPSGDSVHATTFLPRPPPREGVNPADATWLPLGSSGPRQRLSDLAYPHRLVSD